MKVALSVAGSDSGAGAGVQADLKTFSALGVYGCTAITAITAQNTKKVSQIFALNPEIIAGQIESVLTDMQPDAIKVGMVYSKPVIDCVYRSLRRSKCPIVLDPIFAAGSGAKLLLDDAFDSFVSKLVPICTLITPNLMEAERLAGFMIRTERDGIKAAKEIRNKGAKNVIVKGGHFGRKNVTDILLDTNGSLLKISNPRIKIRESHGSGCNFSSAAAAFLAKGLQIEDACRLANEYVHNALMSAVRVGKGLPVTNPLSSIYRDSEKYDVLVQLQRAVEEVVQLPGFARLIPETQTNFGYATSDASEIGEVAAVMGRIVRVGKQAKPASFVEFGASRHVASAILARKNSGFHSAINIKFNNELLRVCKSLFSVSSYDRRKEPAKIKSREGSSIYWGIKTAVAINPQADAIYHTGDLGKESMMIIFGRDPAEVVGKIKSILKNY